MLEGDAVWCGPSEGRPIWSSQPVRVLHTADCHIGSDPTASSALTDLVNMARYVRADVVVISGDLFDDARVSQPLVDWVALTLAKAERPVVVLPGNHDTGGPGSIYERFPATEADGIFVLRDPTGEMLDIPDTSVTVWGRPVIEHTPRFRPLANVPSRPSGRWAIALAHGAVQTGETPTLEGSPIYPSELAAIDWDYVALGHIPMFLPVACPQTVACYAGNTAGTAIAPPGAVVVDLGSAGVIAEWRALEGWRKA